MSKIQSQVIPELHIAEESSQLTPHINTLDSNVVAKIQRPVVYSGRNSKVSKKGFTFESGTHIDGTLPVFFHIYLCTFFDHKLVESNVSCSK